MKEDRRDRFLRVGVVAVVRAFPEKNRVMAIRKIRNAVAEFEDMSLKGTYNAKGVLVPSVHIGKRIRQDKKQRRLVVDAFPKRQPGRPATPEKDLLVARLSSIYLEATGLRGTFDGGDKITLFESFVAPIFRALGLVGEKSAIRKHRESVSSTANVNLK